MESGEGRTNLCGSRFLERRDERVLELSGHEHVFRTQTYLIFCLRESVERGSKGTNLAGVCEPAPEEPSGGRLDITLWINDDRVLA